MGSNSYDQYSPQLTSDVIGYVDDQYPARLGSDNDCVVQCSAHLVFDTDRATNNLNAQYSAHLVPNKDCIISNLPDQYSVHFVSEGPRHQQLDAPRLRQGPRHQLFQRPI